MSWPGPQMGTRKNHNNNQFVKRIDHIHKFGQRPLPNWLRFATPCHLWQENINFMPRRSCPHQPYRFLWILSYPWKPPKPLFTSSPISVYEKWLLMSELHFPFHLISALCATEPIIFFTFQNGHSSNISQYSG